MGFGPFTIPAVLRIWLHSDEQFSRMTGPLKMSAGQTLKRMYLIFDAEFMDVAMRLNPADIMAVNRKMEKWVLRKTFEDYLPGSIAWRQKEQFSDSVYYSWIDSLKTLASQPVTDEQLSNARYRFPVNPPMSKEEYHYRSIFSEHFPSDSAASCVPSVPSVACSTPEALAWDESFRNQNDPSGRSVKSVHLKSY